MPLYESVLMFYLIISIFGLSLWGHEQWTPYAIDPDINRLLFQTFTNYTPYLWITPQLMWCVHRHVASLRTSLESSIVSKYTAQKILCTVRFHRVPFFFMSCIPQMHGNCRLSSGGHFINYLVSIQHIVFLEPCLLFVKLHFSFLTSVYNLLLDWID